MKRLLEKKYINLGFIIALIILISVNVVIYFNIRFHFEDETVITKSLTVIQISETLYSNLIEAETNRRGYLITSNEEFLKDYYPALYSIDSIYRQLNSVVSDSSEKMTLDTLQKLIYNRKDLLEESIEFQEKRSKDYKSQIEFTQKGKITVDKIKAVIERIQNKEKDILNKRLLEAEKSSNYTLSNLVVGNLIAFALLIIAIILLNRNINKRKEAEGTLEENRNWLATTLESIGDAVIVTSKIGEILFMNKIAEDLTGWKSSEANGLLLDHIFKIYNEDTGEKAADPVQNVVRSRKVVALDDHTILVTKNNKEIPIDDSAAPIINDKGDLIGVVMVFRNISERRKSEKEILSNQKFIKRIADSLPSILYIYDLKGPKISYSNYKIAEILGYDSDDVINMGQSFFEKYIHPDDYAKLKSNFARYYEAKDNEILNFEYRILNSAGKYRWFRSHEVVFSRNDEGTVTEILGSAFDITTRKLLEQELQKYSGHLEELVDMRTSELKAANLKLKDEIKERAKAERNIIDAEEKFRSLVENALVGIYILQDEKYVYVNPKYEEIFGYSSGGMTGVNAWEMVSPEHRPLVVENIRKRIDNEVNTIQYSFKAIKKDGTTIDVEVKGSKMLYNGKISIIGTLQDITERVKAEELIKQQREFLRTVIDTDPNFVFAKDWEGRFTLVNKAVSDNYGTTSENLIGKTDADFNENTKEVERFINDDREVITSGSSKFISEEQVTDSNTGKIKWYQTIKVPLKGADGTTHVLGVAADITARKLAEEITIKSLKEKELLLKEIHHRVKNNLQIIVSLLKLQSKFVYDPRDLDIFNKSRSRVETMSLIHEKLYKSKDISQIDIGNYLRDLVSHLLQAYSVNSAKIEFKINAENILMSIDTAIPCGLIVNELINNILKHAFPDGYTGKIELNLWRSDENVVLEISDNGIGIPEAFDLDKSDSLGMRLIDTLVKQLDGIIEVNSLNGSNGTKFVIEFKEIKYKERI